MVSKKSSVWKWLNCLLGVLLVSGLLSVPGTVQQARAAAYYARDQFDSVAYNNNNGTVNWAGDWTEIADNGTPNGGNVQVTGGTLRLNSRVATNDADFEGVQRAINLGGKLNAALSFDFTTANLDGGAGADTVDIQVYNGTSWTTLGTINSASVAGRVSYSISAYANAASAIRFQITQGFDKTNESVFFDNVEVSYTEGGSHTATSVLQTVQTYYVPIPENQVLTALDAVNAAAVSPTTAVISISINSNGTVIYYDQWEDGFEGTVNNPTQSSTDVWGDGNPANGMPPGFSSDYLNGGDIILLNNVIDANNWPPLYTIKYDGGDKIASTEAIAVTRTSWASGSGTLHGGAVEMLDTSVWGTTFVVPIKNATTPTQDFEYTGVAIMASQNGTEVRLNGSLIATLNEGQSYLINNTLTLANDNRITSTHPVQVNLLTGNIGSNYESDWFTLYPTDQLGNEYFAPVNSEGGVTTRVYVHNPNSSAITVNWETTAGAQTAMNVAANNWAYADMPASATGARFYTVGKQVFQALSVIDSGGQANDWGYTLIPANQLTQQVMVGWGVGRDPTSATNPNENGSPVWVIAVGSGTMNICADYNGDGQGALTDNNGRRYDQLITLGNLGRAKVYDSDGNQTGMLVYLCNGSETGNVNKIAAAWGQDPATASAAAPGLDVGTSVPPLPNFTAIKGAELTGDLNGDGKFDVGETFEYQIKINNTGALPVPANTITVEDIIPAYTTYVANSTRLDGVSIADNTTGTAFPLDNGGYTITKQLPIEGHFLVTFRVKIDDAIPSLTTIQNNARVSGLDLEYTPNVNIVVDPPGKIGDTIWLDLDGDGVQDAGEPGLPGVTVGLYSGATLVGTATTDANGKYTFSGLADGTYRVQVATASLPAGVEQTGDPDGCPGAGCDDAVTVTLGAGTKPYWNADFGYMGTVSIGDFVWYDADRDGVQDGGSETGLGNVRVNLTWAGADGLLTTAGDNITFTTLTDGGGHYLFDGLPAGTYLVDLDETSLPNHYAPTTPDPLTLTGLLANTNYVDADFGAAAGASIGDFVWHDLDGDGVQDAGESGLEGVRVYIDSNGNGNYDPGERYDLTDANGKYLIDNLTAGTYSLRVDAASVAAGFTATTPAAVSVTVAAGGSNLTADFGFKGSVLAISKTSSAAGSTSAGSTITYTVNVVNNSGTRQTGISINDPLPAGTSYVANSTAVSGYVAYDDDFSSALYSGSAAYSRSWGTNWVEVSEADGESAGYLQEITAATTPNNTNCPTSGNNCVMVTAVNGNLRQLYRQADLSICSEATLNYTYRNAITSGTTQTYVRTYTGGTLRNTVANYNSTNAGTGTVSYTLSATERAANARVYFIVGAAGNNSANNRVFFDNVYYNCKLSKDNISGGTYLDLVNGTPPVLAKAEDGFTLQPGQTMTATYQVTVNNPASVGRVDNTASVYSVQQLSAQQASTTDALPPSTIGNLVWLDRDNDGIQDSGEPPLAGIPVTLTVTFANNYTRTYTTLTAADGTYTFGGLYVDETYGGQGDGTPTYTLTVATPAGLNPSPSNQGGDDALDSDGSGVKAAFAQGVTDNSYDFGFYSSRVDLGDLPNTYPVQFASGAAHTLFADANADYIPETSGGSAAVWLGTLVDAEANGQPDVNARGDDNTGVDDEDGFQMAEHGWVPGGSSSATITLNSSKTNTRVFYGLWIDWGNNGSFTDANDGFYTGPAQVSGATDVPLTISVPGSYVANTSVYIRLRASTESFVRADYQGTRINGEVEDYVQQFSPTAVQLIQLEARPAASRAWGGWNLLMGAAVLGLAGLVLIRRRKGNR